MWSCVCVCVMSVAVFLFAGFSRGSEAHRPLFVRSLVALHVWAKARQIFHAGVRIYLLDLSWCVPTNTRRSDGSRISKELLVTCQSAQISGTCLFSTFASLLLFLVMLLTCECAVDVLQHTGQAARRLWTEEEGGGGGVATGPEPCSLSFRSAQSRISSLTEMLLSLCQIRPRCYTLHNTTARSEPDPELRDGGIRWEFSLARRRAGPEPGRGSTFLQERLHFKALSNLCRSHCASLPGRGCFYCIGYL